MFRREVTRKRGARGGLLFSFVKGILRENPCEAANLGLLSGIPAVERHPVFRHLALLPGLTGSAGHGGLVLSEPLRHRARQRFENPRARSQRRKWSIARRCRRQTAGPRRAGQHRLHAERLRLEPIVAQEGIEPNELARGHGQTSHLVRETFVGVAVESVGDQQHQCAALTQDAPRRAEVELPDATTDASAPAPILDGRCDPCERIVDVLLVKLSGHVREPDAEGERPAAGRQ